MFAFPVAAGAALIGVLGVYRDILSDLLDVELSARRAHVHQATGLVAAQLEVSVTDALAALRAYAFTHERSLDDVAADVLAWRVRLAPSGEDGPACPASAAAGSGGDGGKSAYPGRPPGGRQEEE